MAVLDYLKEEETRLCLESIRRHVKVEHTVIYLHNGMADYPIQFLREGLVDQLIQTRVNGGLGLGTRDVMAASFSPYTIYHQNDQVFVSDFTGEDLSEMARALGEVSYGVRTLSISLAGAVCGRDVYSERSYLIETSLYREWEKNGLLGYHGAGPYHDGPWREAQIQAYYRATSACHFTWPKRFVMDNGRYAVRDMRAAGVWLHRPDTKRCWNIVPPTERNPVYPQFEPDEWEMALSYAGWPDGRIPRREVGNSFLAWPKLGDADYVARLRAKMK